MILEKRLSLAPADLRKIVLNLSTLPSYSIDKNLERKPIYLMKCLNLAPADLRTIVLLAVPQLLGLNIEDNHNIEPKLQYLEKCLSLQPAGLRKMAIAKPQLLGYSIAISPKLRFLSKSLEPSAEELRDLIV
jgi:hypothetical protein